MLGWLAFVVTGCGRLLIIRRSRIGFLFLGIAAVLWTVYAVGLTPIPAALIVMNGVFFCLDVWGFLRWRKP